MHILICGYYGFGNLGDELILRTIIDQFHLIKPEISITILSNTPKTAEVQDNVSHINRWNPVLIIKAIRFSDTVILGGGGLFQDRTSSLSLYYYLCIMFFAVFLKKKLFVYAVSINKLQGFNRLLAAFALKKSGIITVRDKASLELLKEWGFDTSKIELTADPVFLNTCLEQKKEKGKPKIGLILRGIGKTSELSRKFADLADRLAKYFSAEIVIIPFHSDEDMGFANSILNQITSENKSVFAWKSAEEVHEIYSGLDLIICQRLHGLILAALYAVPFIAVSDDEKLKGFVDEIDSSLIFSYKPFVGERVFNKALELLENKSEFKGNVEKKLPLFKERAQKTSELLMQLIDK